MEQRAVRCAVTCFRSGEAGLAMIDRPVWNWIRGATLDGLFLVFVELEGDVGEQS